MNLCVIYQADLYSCYSALNENGPHRLRYVNSWFPVDGPVWEILGGMSLEKVCQWEWAFRLQKPVSFPIGSLFLLLADKDVSFQYSNPLQLLTPNKLFCNLNRSWCIFTAIQN